MTGPKRVTVLSDGIRGHEHQSMGVALWLSRLSGAEVLKIEIPRLSGARRFLMIKLSARRLSGASPDEARRWLTASGFDTDSMTAGPDTLFISAGSSAAPFCLALSRLTGGKSAVLMTPPVLGVKPFDFAIVPEHDRPAGGANVLVTLGAPNHIYIPELKAEAEKLFAPLRPQIGRASCRERV